MPNRPVPNGIQVRLLWNFQGQLRAVNVLHFHYTGPDVDQVLASNIASAVSSVYQLAGSWRSQVSNAVSLAGIGVRDLRFANRPEYTSSINVLGSVTADPLPMTVAMAVTLRTHLAGRSFRGRVYLTGATESANGATGAINTATHNAGVLFINELRQYMLQQTGAQLAVLSRVSGKELRTVPALTLVNAVESRDNVWDTQRRRRTPVQAL